MSCWGEWAEWKNEMKKLRESWKGEANKQQEKQTLTFAPKPGNCNIFAIVVRTPKWTMEEKDLKKAKRTRDGKFVQATGGPNCRNEWRWSEPGLSGTWTACQHSGPKIDWPPVEVDSDGLKKCHFAFSLHCPRATFRPLCFQISWPVKNLTRPTGGASQVSGVQSKCNNRGKRKVFEMRKERW